MYNKVIVIGNLTRDIELKILPSGTSVANSSIASSYKYKTKTGEQKEEVCFLEFSLFGKSAEIINQYTHKGSKVMLEGRLAFEQWLDQSGGKRSRHVLRVDTFKFLDPAPSTQQAAPQQQGYATQQQNSQVMPPQQAQQPQSNNQGTTQQQEKVPYANVPDVDIDNDEIPF